MATLKTLIPLLQQTQKGLTGEPLGSIDIADIIWLATQLKLSQPFTLEQEHEDHEEAGSQAGQGQNETTSQPDQTEVKVKEKPDQDNNDVLPETETESEQSSERKVSVTPTGSPAAQKAQNIPFNVPAARAIPHHHQISRSLRSLNRKVPSRIKKQIDIKATIRRISEEQLSIPVYEPAPRRWLDIALVIEQTDSFGIWEQTTKELMQLLLRQGAFRDVKRWYAHTDKDKGLVLKSLGGNLRHPKELIFPQGDRLILLVSDCISDAWYRRKKGTQTSPYVSKGKKLRTWLDWITLWQGFHPVTIIQMLPSKFWQRTALGNMEALWMSSQKAGALNYKWQVERETAWDEKKVEGIPIPVLNLDPYVLKAWAKGVAGTSQIQVSGLSFEGIDRFTEPTDNQGKVYDNFMQFGSPVAKRLAALLSAVPIQLPIVRLVQKNLLKNESSAVQVAEIFFSGILSPRNSETDPEKRLYDFVGDFRSRLNQTIPKSEVATVIDCLSRDIMRRAGFDSMDEFRACLVAQPTEDDDPLTNEISEFARVSLDVLQRLGGEYAAFVQTLEQKHSGPQWPDIETFEFQPPKIFIQDETDRPSIETEEIDVVTISLGSYRHKIDFDVVRLVRPIDSTHYEIDSSWRQEVDRIQAEGFTEELSENVSLEMVFIPGGPFWMGSIDEGSEDFQRPQHNVEVSPFAMGRYLVTQRQWKEIASMHQVEHALKIVPSYFQGMSQPVEQVSWEDTVEFCQRLSNFTGRIYRLPTEAEWEYACRAGTTTPFHYGETITLDLANYGGSRTYGDGPRGKYRQQTIDVGSFPPNANGLHDMHGNLWEWCADHWHNNYEDAPSDGQAWIDDNQDRYRVLRGGSWDSSLGSCRSTYRTSTSPALRDINLGFRVVCEF